MRFLIEAHHPAHIHFWKYPIRELIERGHEVLMIGRERDVMRRLLEAYDWIPYEIPERRSSKNRFPAKEMLQRQWTVARAIRRFKPDTVASLMGSYCQSARLLGKRNIIFTDTETQRFNHRISHPFASEVHTPDRFSLDLGRKQLRYAGIHELCFLDGRRFQPDAGVLDKYGLSAGNYLLLRTSAWNTFHDRSRSGLGESVYEFVERFKDRYRIALSAEEGKAPPGLEGYMMRFAPEDFHHFLAYARFVLTEGASTSSEAACLGVPSVFVNSTEPLGIPLMLENGYGLVRSFQEGETGVRCAIEWLEELGENGESRLSLESGKKRLVEDHTDVCEYVVNTLLS